MICEHVRVHHLHSQSTIHGQKESVALLSRPLEERSAALGSAPYLEPDQSQRCSKLRYLELAAKLIWQVSSWLLPKYGSNSCRKFSIAPHVSSTILHPILDARDSPRVQVPRNVSALSDARFHEGVKAGTVLGARSIKPFERSRPWLRRTRALCKFNGGKVQCGDPPELRDRAQQASLGEEKVM